MFQIVQDLAAGTFTADDITVSSGTKGTFTTVTANRVYTLVVTNTESTTQIACRRPDIPIIAVCNDEITANQLCLSRGVFPIYNDYLFGERDAFTATRQFGIGVGKIVVVDEDKISLTTLE